MVPSNDDFFGNAWSVSTGKPTLIEKKRSTFATYWKSMTCYNCIYSSTGWSPQYIYIYTWQHQKKLKLTPLRSSCMNTPACCTLTSAFIFNPWFNFCSTNDSTMGIRWLHVAYLMLEIGGLRWWFKVANQHGYLLFVASLGGILLLILHLLQGYGTSEFSSSCSHLTLLLFQAVDLVLGQTVGLYNEKGFWGWGWWWSWWSSSWQY